MASFQLTSDLCPRFRRRRGDPQQRPGDSHDEGAVRAGAGPAEGGGPSIHVQQHPAGVAAPKPPPLQLHIQLKDTVMAEKGMEISSLEFLQRESFCLIVCLFVIII